MKFTPITAEEAQKLKFGLWDEKDYGFEVAAVLDRPSKKGNEMFTLTLNVFNESGQIKQINDYLILSEGQQWKIRQAALSCGLQKEYESGHLEATDFLNKSGKLLLKIQKSKDPQYADKNVVADYYIDSSSPTIQPHSSIELNDDIPF